MIVTNGEPSGGIGLRVASLALAAALLPEAHVSAEGSDRFREIDRLRPGAADWLAASGDRIVFGSARRLFLARGGSRPALVGTIDVDSPVLGAALMGSRLFLVGPGTRLRSLDLKAPSARPKDVPLDPEPRGRLHLAATDGYLAVAEDGYGLRFLSFDGPVGGHTAHGSIGGREARLLPAGFLALPESFTATVASQRTVYAAIRGGGLVEIDARDPSAPRLLRRLPHEGAVEALAVDRSRLFLLQRSGLEILELRTEGWPRGDLHTGVAGRSIQIAGRALHVAAGEIGLLTYLDRSGPRQMHDVSVNDKFFSPEDLTIAIGDTVRWTNVTGTLHNVFSCTPDQVGCNGVAEETFGSGEPQDFFVYDHTFTEAGSNPYLCQPHATFMAGTVEVTGTGSAPPGVPDGVTGPAMTVEKLVAGGSSLSVVWDTTTCAGAVDHEILYGYGSQLPSEPGGTYGLSGSRCAIGVASPFTWAGVPPAFAGPQGFLWWLVVATDGGPTEGSWGRDGSGAERSGPASGGASGECGIAIRSLGNPCGH